LHYALSLLSLSLGACNEIRQKEMADSIHYTHFVRKQLEEIRINDAIAGNWHLMEMRLRCSLIRFDIEIIFPFPSAASAHSQLRMLESERARQKDKLMFSVESVIEFHRDAIMGLANFKLNI
jgi:hypothetical protein